MIEIKDENRLAWGLISARHPFGDTSFHCRGSINHIALYSVNPVKNYYLIRSFP